MQCPADHMAYGLSVVVAGSFLFLSQRLQSIQSDKMENLICPKRRHTRDRFEAFFAAGPGAGERQMVVDGAAPVVVCCCCANGLLPACWNAARRVVRSRARARSACAVPCCDVLKRMYETSRSPRVRVPARVPPCCIREARPACWHDTRRGGAPRRALPSGGFRGCESSNVGHAHRLARATVTHTRTLTHTHTPPAPAPPPPARAFKCAFFARAWRVKMRIVFASLRGCGHGGIRARDGVLATRRARVAVGGESPL